jgi:hypothetical protein
LIWVELWLIEGWLVHRHPIIIIDRRHWLVAVGRLWWPKITWWWILKLLHLLWHLLHHWWILHFLVRDLVLRHLPSGRRLRSWPSSRPTLAIRIIIHLSLQFLSFSSNLISSFSLFIFFLFLDLLLPKVEILTLFILASLLFLFTKLKASSSWQLRLHILLFAPLRWGTINLSLSLL